MILKPLTPQNIVIGGLSGAMPPALGWAAIANAVPAEAWLLVLIIFIWTPPHFWALALYRQHDYQRSGLPMLPVTHGKTFTTLHVLLYSYILMASSLLPFIIRMSGPLYLAAGPCWAHVSFNTPINCIATTAMSCPASYSAFPLFIWPSCLGRCCWIIGSCLI